MRPGPVSGASDRAIPSERSQRFMSPMIGPMWHRIPGVDGQTGRRIGENEAAFREVNEIIERGRWPAEGRPVAFRCECAQLECNRLIDLSIAEYEEIRRHSRRFAVAPGHAVEGEAERMVEIRPGHIVVEKTGTAGSVADETDPRG